jgi:regulatory protein YycI of two-component signal transduction system YycFG
MIIGMFLGMVMVLGILGVVVMVKMYSDIKKLKRLGKSQEEIIREDNLSIHRRIDGEIDRTNKLSEATNRYSNGRIDKVYKEIEEVYRQMDSRLDRLTNKMSNPVKKDLLQD